MHSVSAWCCMCVCVCLWVWRKAPKTNTSGMPPAERGLRGWMCVYGSVLAARGREPVQNNGTTLECGTAGNILSQTRGSRGVWGGALCRKTFFGKTVFFLYQDGRHPARPLTPLCGWQPNADACNRLSFDCFHFHTTTKLEDHVPWNISQTCDSFTENLYPNVRASTVAASKSQWIWSVSISLQAVH